VGVRATRALQGLTPLAKEIAVTELVNRVFEVESAQEGIGCDLGGAQDVPAAVGFDFAEQEQLADPSLRIGPHPLVEGAASADPPHGRISCRHHTA